jgi:predicted site-specific integrase-resolvase
MALDLPTYIPLEKAAEQFNIAAETLRQNVEDGTVRAAKTPAGNVLVAGEDIESSPPEIDTRLKGQPIRAIDAAEKYDLAHGSLTRWVKSGYVNVLERGPKLLVLDEAEVKLAAAIFHHAKEKNQVPMFVLAGFSNAP